jgi:hypothetical protein
MSALESLEQSMFEPDTFSVFSAKPITVVLTGPWLPEP